LKLVVFHGCYLLISTVPILASKGNHKMGQTGQIPQG